MHHHSEEEVHDHDHDEDDDEIVEEEEHVAVDPMDSAQPANLTAEEPASPVESNDPVSNNALTLIIAIATVATVCTAFFAYCLIRKCSQQKSSSQASDVDTTARVPADDSSMQSPDKRHKRDNSSAQFLAVDDSSKSKVEDSARTDAVEAFDDSNYNSNAKLRPVPATVDETKA